MSLKNLGLPSIIDKSTADMAADFYVPALSVSVRYDRGVSFFSSGWLRMTIQGLLPFAGNGIKQTVSILVRTLMRSENCSRGEDVVYNQFKLLKIKFMHKLHRIGKT